jgi:hypothetical protein
MMARKKTGDIKALGLSGSVASTATATDATARPYLNTAGTSRRVGMFRCSMGVAEERSTVDHSITRSARPLVPCR